MFICEECGKVSKLYRPTHRITVEKRERTYFYTVIEIKKSRNNKTKKIRIFVECTEDTDKQIVKKSTGWEIVKELQLCGECNERHEKNKENT